MPTTTNTLFRQNLRMRGLSGPLLVAIGMPSGACAIGNFWHFVALR